MKNKKGKIKYVLYARKSSESEERQCSSIKDQIDETKKVAKRKGLKISKIITEAKSAKEPGREGFNEMVKLLKKEEVKGILCWNLNRLARNPVDGGAINWMLQKGIIKKIVTPRDTYDPSSNVLMTSVKFGMANQEIKDLSEDVQRG